MYLFPSIDLRGGQVVRLHQGDYEQQTSYGNNPLQQASEFADAGATWLHVVDLDGAKSGHVVHRQVIKQICEQTALKVEVGGGVRTQDSIDELLSVGVERVILGTAALRNWNWFEDLVTVPENSGRLVLGLDARSGKLAVDGWQHQLQLTAVDIAKRVNGWPLAAIVYTDISTDGTMQGPNIDATQQIAELTTVPIVASGGVGNLDHMRTLRQLSIQGVIIGRALYEHAFALKEALVVIEQVEPTESSD